MIVSIELNTRSNIMDNVATFKYFLIIAYTLILHRRFYFKTYNQETNTYTHQKNGENNIKKNSVKQCKLEHQY